MNIRETMEYLAKNGETILPTEKPPTIKELKEHAKQHKKRGEYDEAQKCLAIVAASEESEAILGHISKNTQRAINGVYNAEAAAKKKKKILNG